MRGSIWKKWFLQMWQPTALPGWINVQRRKLHPRGRYVTTNLINDTVQLNFSKYNITNISKNNF